MQALTSDFSQFSLIPRNHKYIDSESVEGKPITKQYFTGRSGCVYLDFSRGLRIGNPPGGSMPTVEERGERWRADDGSLAPNLVVFEEPGH